MVNSHVHGTGQMNGSFFKWLASALASIVVALAVFAGTIMLHQLDKMQSQLELNSSELQTVHARQDAVISNLQTHQQMMERLFQQQDNPKR